MKKLIIIAPNDRYNYGDLLFTHIIKWQLKDCYDGFIDIATIDNDLSNVGGNKVHSIKYLYKLSKDEKCDLIVAGGESLFSPWTICLSYLSEKYAIIQYVLRLLRRLFNSNIIFRIENKLGALLFNARTQYPYTIGKNEISFINKLFYNSVGGNSLSNNIINHSNINILKTADYLSVRDQNSYDILQSKNLNCNLVPDSAILMSTLYSIPDLNKYISKNISVTSNEKYIVFQINLLFGTKFFNEICELLHLIHNKFNVKIILCPIGYALGHDDHKVLSQIANTMNSDYIICFNEVLKVWDIMYLIANSQLFIGSSLHGVITAMSYNVPYIGILVDKTISYIKTWGLSKNSYSYNLELMDKIKYHLSSSNDELMKINSNIQKEKSLQSFKTMRMIANEYN